MTEAALRRGQIFWVDWNPARGSEQAGRRPAIIVQNDPYNRNDRYPNTIVAAISTRGRDVPTHVLLEPDSLNGLNARSYVKCEQIVTIAKDRLSQTIGSVDPETMDQIDRALKRVLSLL